MLRNKRIEADLVERLVALSGSGKRVVSTRTHGLYCSVELEAFKHLEAVRDTAIRFEKFGEPLEGRYVLDIGCNVGAMTWGALLRGAKSVQGYEFNKDRVCLCRDIAAYYKLPATFQQADFNVAYPELEAPVEVAMCFSVDEYIENRPWFYEQLFLSTGDTLLFESNVQRDQSVDDTKEMLHAAGFKTVTYKGTGHSGGISRKRHTFVCKV